MTSLPLYNILIDYFNGDDIVDEDLREIRRYLGLSQVKISLDCGWGCNYVGHVESRKIKNMSYKNAHKIAVFLVKEIKKQNKKVKDVEDYIGYYPFLDLLYAIEQKDRDLDDLDLDEVCI